MRGSDAAKVARRTRALDPSTPVVRPEFVFSMVPTWVAQELTPIGATFTSVCLLPKLWRSAAGHEVRLEAFDPGFVA